MVEYSRFTAVGRVSDVQERFSAKGNRLAQLHLIKGGDYGKAECVLRISFFDGDEVPRVLRLRRGSRVLVMGRLEGMVSDKGYFNATLYGDSVFCAEDLPAPAPAAAPTGGRPGAAAPVPGGAAPAAQGESDEDIPF